MDPKPMRLSDRDREDLRGYFVDAISSVAGFRAQRYEAAVLGGVRDFGMSDPQMVAAARYRRVDRTRLDMLAHGEETHWGVLAVAYGPMAPDDAAIETARLATLNATAASKRERGKTPDLAAPIEAHLTPLLRLTDAMQMEATRLWIADERKRLLALDPHWDDTNVDGSPKRPLALPLTAGTTRSMATLCIRGLSVDHERPKTATLRREFAKEHRQLQEQARGEAACLLTAAGEAYVVARREVSAAMREELKLRAAFEAQSNAARKLERLLAEARLLASSGHRA